MKYGIYKLEIGIIRTYHYFLLTKNAESEGFQKIAETRTVAEAKAYLKDNKLDIEMI